MIPLGKEKCVLYSEIAGAVTDLFLNAVLIPVLGATGAAIGTLVAEIVVVAVQWYSIRNDFPDIFFGINIKDISVSCIIAVLASILFHFTGLSDFLKLFFSAILFFAMYLGIMVFLFKNPLLIQYLPFKRQEK